MITTTRQDTGREYRARREDPATVLARRNPHHADPDRGDVTAIRTLNRKPKGSRT